MSGELLLIVKLKARSSTVSEFCCSGKLLKHMAVRSAVENGTFGGYKISISGPMVINACVHRVRGLGFHTNVDIKVANNPLSSVSHIQERPF